MGRKMRVHPNKKEVSALIVALETERLITNDRIKHAKEWDIEAHTTKDSARLDLLTNLQERLRDQADGSYKVFEIDY